MKVESKIQELEARIEALETALRLAIDWLNEDDRPAADYAKMLAALVPEKSHEDERDDALASLGWFGDK